MRIRYKLHLPASASEVFDLLHDYSRRPSWDPVMPDSVLIGEQVARKGAVVRCRDRLGFSMDTVYSGFRRPYSASVRMTTGPWPFSRLGGSWRLKPAGARDCQLFITYNIKTTPRLARIVIEPFVCAVFYFQTVRRMRALQRHLAKSK